MKAQEDFKFDTQKTKSYRKKQRKFYLKKHTPNHTSILKTIPGNKIPFVSIFASIFFKYLFLKVA